MLIFLGPSSHFTKTIRESRYHKFKSSNIYSVEATLEIMKSTKYNGKLVYNFSPAIPYSTLKLAPDLSNNELKDAGKEIIFKILDKIILYFYQFQL